MIPYVRDMWAHGSHLPAYHTNYLFPYISPVLTSDGTVRALGVPQGVVNMNLQTREKAVLIIRRMFLEAVKTYVHPFLGTAEHQGNEGKSSSSVGSIPLEVHGKKMPGHSALWRSGSTAVIVLDLASAWRPLTVSNKI